MDAASLPAIGDSVDSYEISRRSRVCAPAASDVSTALWSNTLLCSTSVVSHVSFANMNNRPAVDPAAILFKGVGTWGAIAVAVAGMAPTMAMNLNPQEPAEHVGRVVPLVFLRSEEHTSELQSQR